MHTFLSYAIPFVTRLLVARAVNKRNANRLQPPATSSSLEHEMMTNQMPMMRQMHDPGNHQG